MLRSLSCNLQSGAELLGNGNLSNQLRLDNYPNHCETLKNTNLLILFNIEHKKPVLRRVDLRIWWLWRDSIDIDFIGFIFIILFIARNIAHKNKTTQDFSPANISAWSISRNE
jgi:hypothetical protein